MKYIWRLKPLQVMKVIDLSQKTHNMGRHPQYAAPIVQANYLH